MTDLTKLNSKLSYIQKNLKAPKNQFNKFGNYKYRSCEDILEGLKTLLDDDTSITVSDEIVNVGDRFYVKATATFRYKDDEIKVFAYAREAETKKGMDVAQVTGATSSYARKYALNGLFCIDDTKDADTMNNSNSNGNSNGNSNYQKPKITLSPQEKQTQELRNLISVLTCNFKDSEAIKELCKDTGVNELKEIHSKDFQTKEEIIEFFKRKITGKKSELKPTGN